MSANPKRLGRWLLVLLVLAVALPAGYLFARHQAWPAYKEWRGQRLTRMAREFLQVGQYDDALLAARQGLRNNQRNLALWRLAAEAARAKRSPDAIYYQLNVARLDKSLSSQLDVIRLALEHHDYRDALDAIEAVDEQGQRDAEFHRLAAETYRLVARPVPAKLHLNSLLSLEPQNDAARLDLAELELAEDANGRNPAVREELQRLSRVATLRGRALSLLVRDALQREDAAAARRWAKELQHSPQLNPEQRVLVLRGLARAGDPDAAAYRRRLETDFADDPLSVVALANYYREFGPADAARSWFDSLPEGTKASVPVQEAMASAYLAWADWSRLDGAVQGRQWKEREFMRHALQAYAARRTGRFADAGNSWRLAVIQAGENARQTSELLMLVGQWDWQSEQYELVWKLFALMPRNESVSRQLLAWERLQGHTANLNRIFARQLEFAGDDRMLRNNFAYSSLLLDSNLPRAIEFARENLRAEPRNPYYVTTQALALFKQDKAADALALLEQLRPAELSTPERTVFRALFRAASGDVDGAADLLAGAKVAGLLPEERRLAERAGSLVAARSGEQGEDRKLLALSSRGDIDSRKGWLQAMPDSVRSRASSEMLTSDSLFAVGDWSALASQLRKGTWRDGEHLRFALTAYAARQRPAVGGDQTYWRSAIGSAGRDASKLQELEALASHWGWQPERIDALARRFTVEPTDDRAFEELVRHYRSAGRTPELVAVLNAYVAAHPADQRQRSHLAYYSMLSGLNVSRAYVVAQEAYQADPAVEEGRLVYAFALWKQRRATEAWEVLESTAAGGAARVPPALVRAVVLADLQRRDEAARMLENFDASNALPEEATLANVLASRLRDRNVSGLN